MDKVIQKMQELQGAEVEHVYLEGMVVRFLIGN